MLDDKLIAKWVSDKAENGKYGEIVEYLFNQSSVRAINILLHLIATLNQSQQELFLAEAKLVSWYPKFDRRKGSNLPGHIGTLLRFMNADKDELGKYLYFDSRTWRAIRSHVAYEKECLLIDREPYQIVMHRGTGPAITICDVHGFCDHFDQDENWHTTRTPATVFHLSFSVAYEREYSKQYSLTVPLELEDDCPKADFDTRFVSWAQQVKAERDERARKDELPLLEKLVKQYPKDARRLLQKPKRSIV